MTVAERVAIAAASLVLSLGLIALMSGFFAARDQAMVSTGGDGPGQAFRDLGHAHLRPGQAHPPYDSSPPTSGAHVPIPITHDRTELSDDQLLQALELGDVVIAYGGAKPPPDLARLSHNLAPPFSPALAAAGQAVILARRPGTQGVTALAWAHMARLPSAGDPLLQTFVQYWLGRGAPGG
jgi:hypothetical protein